MIDSASTCHLLSTVRPIMEPSTHSLPEKVLLAAFDLEQEGQSPFSAEALIVRAWKGHPRAFGLKGFAEQYPDSNKVLSCIMGVRGLAKRGLLSRVGQKLYELTREGRQVVLRLIPAEDLPLLEAQPVTLSPDVDRLMQGLLASSAFQKERQGRRNELNFADACRFWGVTEHLSAADLTARLERVRRSLNEAQRLIGRGQAPLGNGKSLSAADVEALGALDEHLTTHFERHLTLLRNRAESRR
jgi:hypothetical protein